MDQTGRLKIDVSFLRGGPGSTGQFSCFFRRERPDGRRVTLQSYEGIWRMPTTWNYLTEMNAKKCVAHFARLITVCDTLV